MWTNIGPAGTMLHAVAADPDDPRHLILLDVSGLAHETHDRGASWTVGVVRTCGSSNAFIHSGTYYVACTYSAQSTTDGGQTWRTFYPDPWNIYGLIFSVQLDPSKSGSALTSDLSGPIFTYDGGRGWSRGRSPGTPNGPARFSYDPSRSGRILAVSDQPGPTVGAFQSMAWDSGDGTTWRSLGVLRNFTGDAPCWTRSIAVDPAGTVYALGDCGAYASRDGGSTWTFHDLGGTSLGLTLGLAIDPSRVGHVATVTPLAILETTDSGSTWNRVPSPPSSGNEYISITFAADGAAWGTTSKGLFRRDSPDAPWTSVAVPALPANAAYVVPMTPDGLVLLTGDQRSSDGGATWNARTDGLGRPIAVAGEPLQFYAPTTSSPSSYQLTTDGGATWKPANVVLADSKGTPIGGLVPAGPQPGIIYANTLVADNLFDTTFWVPGGLVGSGDGGHTWSSIDAAITGGGRSAVVSAANSAVVYTTGQDGVFRSDNSGATWKLVRAGRADQVVPDGVDPMAFYVLTGTSIAASADGGATFSVSSADTVNTTQAIIADPVQAGGAYVVSADGAAFETLDHGVSWQRIAVRESQALDSLDSPVSTPVPAIPVSSKRLLRAANYTVESLAIPDAPIVLGTATWWNPAESGWGVSISQHQDGQVVAVWYYYDASGKPRWAIVPGGTWTDAHTFSGTMYTTRWTGFAAGLRIPANLAVSAAGTGTFRFTDGRTADVSFVFNDGTRSDRHIVRQVFASDPTTGVDFSDLWWNPYESGWGVVMQQIAGTVFTTMFLYDELGNPTWLVAPNTSLSASGTTVHTSDLDATMGPPYTGAFDPARVTVTKVGTFSLMFSESTWLNYVVSGQSRMVSIEREPF